MTKRKSYEEHIKEKYPEAICWDINNSRRFFRTSYHLYKIISNSGDLSAYEYSEDTAWKSAYEKIIEKGLEVSES